MHAKKPAVLLQGFIRGPMVLVRFLKTVQDGSKTGKGVHSDTPLCCRFAPNDPDLVLTTGQDAKLFVTSVNGGSDCSFESHLGLSHEFGTGPFESMKTVDATPFSITCFLCHIHT
ncbi:unnamed protein product [Gongylonema pulchrum]|uniref:WD_REPEATS_REGION domain-containing protein n=1 Tax=Gongylonema pulchrum TaxID=637853 RepID=A0A183EXE4_9BILA|nr:unnamed protein product [Gongylonema pulchrum]